MHDSETLSLLNVVHRHYLPYKCLIRLTGTERFLTSHNELLKTLTQKDNKPTAFVCKNRQCSLPVNSPEELEKLLQ